ncbi:MAG: NUDIX hydrolase [Sphingobacteriia bacterium]|nr:NUDIX hydrolase [Sphingobacteriia bacterium]
MQAEINPWKIIDEALVYDNKFISLTHYNIINPSGNKGIYGKVHFKNIAMGIIPVDTEGNTYLVGQYRFTLNQYSWEIPEGGCPFNEEPLEGAKRELLEETGLVAAHWHVLGKSYLSNSVSDEMAIAYVATGLLQMQAQPEDTEQLQIKKVSLEKAFDMVNSGEISDALSVMALQKLQLLLLQHKIKF